MHRLLLRNFATGLDARRDEVNIPSFFLFKNYIFKSNDIFIYMKVIMFGNDRCGSCRKWKPTFERLMNEYQLDYEYVDIEQDKNKKLQYNIQGIPVTIFFNDNGEEIGNILGNMDEDIARKQIEYYKNV